MRVDPLTTSDICEHQEEVSASPGPGSHVRGATVRWADWPGDLPQTSPFTAGVLHHGGNSEKYPIKEITSVLKPTNKCLIF